MEFSLAPAMRAYNGRWEPDKANAEATDTDREERGRLPRGSRGIHLCDGILDN